MRNHNTDNQNGGGPSAKGNRAASPTPEQIVDQQQKQGDTQALFQHQQYIDSDDIVSWFKNLPFRLLYKISRKNPTIGAVVGAVFGALVPLSLIFGIYCWYDFHFGFTLANLFFAAIASASSAYSYSTAYKNISYANDSFRLPPCIVRNDQMRGQMQGGTRRKEGKNTKKNNYSNHRKMSKKINKRTSNIRRRTIKY
jgi:hypothetical protein